MVDLWLQKVIQNSADLFPDGTFLNQPFNLKALVAILLVSLICGAVGSLVVGNRMAFFSDALSHCAFAGIALGFLTALLFGIHDQDNLYNWALPVMVVFGILVGLGIAYVREKTALASDTVIGVFFAGAIGFGAMLLTAVSKKRYFNPEAFLFGSPITVSTTDLLILFVLAVVTGVFLVFLYNGLVFASFNTSLARSRRVPVRLGSYLFIALLAVLVNVCLKTVGALLINALLIVPAATASNVCRNMRQLFWTTIVLCAIVGLGGQWLSWEIAIPTRNEEPIYFGTAGTIVVLSVVLFYLSIVLGPMLRRRRLAASR